MTTRRRTRAAIGVATTAALVGAGIIATALAPAQASAGCQARVETQSQWPGGFTAAVTVTNLGDAVDGWEVGWDFDGDARVASVWSARLASQESGDVVVRDAGYNARIATGATASFGFQATGTPGASAVTLNGVLCTGTVDPGPTATPTTEPTANPTTGPTPSGALYVDTTNQSARAAAAATGETRRLLEKISTTPQATWIGDWTSSSAAASAAGDFTRRAQQAGATGVLVVYAIPGRDCGSYSGGGVETSEYARWVDTVAAAIVGNPIVVLEPDALAQLGSCSGQGDRVGFLRYAAHSLTAAGARVYIDAGHSAWLAPEEAARRLNQVGFADAVGFALNTSNYQTTAASQAYGERISQLVGGKGYVIDTSRNGNGSNGEWCNPRGRALGERPRLVNDGTALDALLWVKLPGESDGTCNGGPAAGQWFQDMALELARNAAW